MPDDAPLDGTLAALARGGLSDVLVLGLRHSDDLPLPFYRPFLLAGFWLELGDGVVWFEASQGFLAATPAARPELPVWVDHDGAEDMCILSGAGFTLDPAREPAPISALELVARDDDALREARIAAVFLRCTDGAELFAHAWSFDGVTFGRAPEYATWREENSYFAGWGRFRWEAGDLPWTWASRRTLAMRP
ncbi:hypothetical protein [Nannocystis punicea]|uniref:Uncharacterized protein n=1 Tax=Nannocystis punicea TaxID=2995304 RepID=A0ABY7H931_9BACT|nr:hypothetical protein [Nannocystis poenicansa]WAS95600.1 hypothetical protein O0S08_05510 [Nannocystis poenicansa]